ncbi:MAG: helix-turn-helix transcriptional regulator, partial [bacterium]|nr:helix-turn-helix transcriptional regulator [bacterium]
MKHIGYIIKPLREKHGMSQKQIADLLNMHASNYSRVESGERDLSINSIKKLADFFNMTVDQFINLNEKSIPEEIFTEDKSVAERIKLISKLDKQERSVI